MKTLVAVSGLGVSFLGVIGALGWILAIGIAILLPGGSLLMLAAHYYHRKHGPQTQQPLPLKHAPAAA